MKVEENNKQEELKDEQLDNVSGGVKANRVSKESQTSTPNSLKRYVKSRQFNH